MAFSPTEYCRLFAQKKAYQGGGGGGHGHPRTPLATPLTPYEFLILNNSMLLCLTFNVIIKFSCDYMEKITEHMVDYRA